MDIEILDENTIKVTTQPPTPEPVVQTYDIKFLLQQKIDIQAQADAFAAARQKEIDDIDAILNTPEVTKKVEVILNKDVNKKEVPNVV